MKRGVHEGVKQHVIGAQGGGTRGGNHEAEQLDVESIIRNRAPLVNAKEQFKRGVDRLGDEEVTRRREAIKEAFKVGRVAGGRLQVLLDCILS